MYEGNKESILNNYPIPITIEENNLIIEQMQKCICKIHKNNGEKGSGFFCYIPLGNSNLPVLITNNHVINKDYFKNNSLINLTLNDDKDTKIIKIGNTRKIYSSDKYDTTIIEIFPLIDKINYFLELEDNIFKQTESFYRKSSIYIMHYPKSQKVCVSYGILKDISDYDIFHYFSTENGSSGSPILSLLNKKIIGIHKEGRKNYNKGTFLKYPITEFINLINQNRIHNSKIINKKIENNNSMILKNNYSNHCLGLENIGGNIYMNSILQCLCHVTSLKNYFQSPSLVTKDINNKEAPMTKSFFELLNKLWSQAYETYYSPHNFKNLISNLNPLFRGIQSNDPKDLINFIYETLHNELNNPTLDNYILNNLNNQNLPAELKLFRQNYFSQNNSIMTKIFYFEQSSNLKCCSCNRNNVSFNIINFLNFPLEIIRLYLEKKNPRGFLYVTLENCFEQFEEQELLYGPNQIYCTSCHRMSNRIAYSRLYNSPEVLTIILNRGKGLQFDVEFIFPLDLNINKYVLDKNCDTNYELIGVVIPIGSEMSEHFIAFCKSPVNKKWYRYNDAVVTQCNNVMHEINSNGIPYILYYQRKNILAKKE